MIASYQFIGFAKSGYLFPGTVVSIIENWVMMPKFQNLFRTDGLSSLDKKIKSQGKKSESAENIH